MAISCSTRIRIVTQISGVQLPVGPLPNALEYSNMKIMVIGSMIFAREILKVKEELTELGYSGLEKHLES